MTYETIVRRGERGDLRAETDIDLGSERRVLQIHTRKDGTRGGIYSVASVHQRSEDGLSLTHAIGFGVHGLGDYRQTLERAPTLRCTEKNVRTLHARALETVDQILAAARSHYAAKADA